IQCFIGYEKPRLILIKRAENFQPATLVHRTACGSDHPPYGIPNRDKCPACSSGSPKTRPTYTSLEETGWACFTTQSEPVNFPACAFRVRHVGPLKNELQCELKVSSHVRLPGNDAE